MRSVRGGTVREWYSGTRDNTRRSYIQLHESFHARACAGEVKPFASEDREEVFRDDTISMLKRRFSSAARSVLPRTKSLHLVSWVCRTTSSRSRAGFSAPERHSSSSTTRTSSRSSSTMRCPLDVLFSLRCSSRLSDNATYPNTANCFATRKRARHPAHAH
jgi:hypothetical protein